MPRTEWRLKGDWIKNCNCAFGCPCDFNARPTNGTCQGLVGMHIANGRMAFDAPSRADNLRSRESSLKIKSNSFQSS
jgi:hypothetical protein